MKLIFLKLRVCVVVFGLFLALIGWCEDGKAQQAGRKVYVVPVSGTVDAGMAAFIKRVFENPERDSKALFVLKLDTFGGRVDSALQIVDTLIADPEIETLAYVQSKAISAGALIALACNRLVMQKNTTIGDCAPIAYSNEGPKELGEKFQSPLRAKFRALAKRNNYPEALTEAMVTADMTVYAVEIEGQTQYLDGHAFDDLTDTQKATVTSKKTIIAKGELLTMDDTEARQLGFSRLSVRTLEEALAQLQLGPYELISIEESWSVTYVRFIGTISPYLLMLGMAALYMEIKAPGFGVLGIIGIICLAVVFLNQYAVGLADYTEFLLVATGIILLGFELFVLPGFGISGIAGLIFIAIGAILALQDFVIPDPSLPWQADLLLKNVLIVLGSLLAAIPVALFGLRYVLPKLALVGQGPYLDTTLKAVRAESVEAAGAQTGDTGVTATFMRPSGKVRINNEIYDAIAEGEFLAKGTPVTVSEIKGNRIIVRAQRVAEELENE